MNDRDLILSQLPETGATALPQAWRNPLADVDLWPLFWERFQSLGGQRMDRAELSRFPGRRWSVDPGTALPEEAGFTVSAAPWEADLGVTTALVAVAETGSLLLSGGRRLGSLAPPAHLALVRREAIVENLEQAFDRLESRTSVIVTGPSRTADIEGVLVRGVHGPRDVFVLVLD